MKDKDYDFNVCIKCQKIKDVPCVEDCKYLEELEKGDDYRVSSMNH